MTKKTWLLKCFQKWAVLEDRVKEKNFMEEFESYLLDNLPEVKSFHPYFQKALVEMLKAGGKRFRPYLLLSVVNSYEPLLVKNSFGVAAAVEYIHTYSLIHDDLPIFDDADFRRGHPTLHVTYEEVTATLVGDALNTHAFYLIADSPLSDSVKTKLTKELSLNGGAYGMVLGQAIDCYFENKTLDFEKLKFLHIHKTAKLIAASLKMGAVIANLSKECADTLYDIGINLGLLFQIEDDLIDATKSSKEAGKPTNNDTVKNSFVNLFGIEGTKKKKEQMLHLLDEELSVLNPTLKSKLQKIINKYFK